MVNMVWDNPDSIRGRSSLAVPHVGKISRVEEETVALLRGGGGMFSRFES
jgi:hypothetical protein